MILKIEKERKERFWWEKCRPNIASDQVQQQAKFIRGQGHDDEYIPGDLSSEGDPPSSPLRNALVRRSAHGPASSLKAPVPKQQETPKDSVTESRKAPDASAPVPGSARAVAIPVPDDEVGEARGVRGRPDIEILAHHDIAAILSDTGKTWQLLQELQANLAAQDMGLVRLGLPRDPEELLEHLEDNAEQDEFQDYLKDYYALESLRPLYVAMLQRASESANSHVAEGHQAAMLRLYEWGAKYTSAPAAAPIAANVTAAAAVPSSGYTTSAGGSSDEEGSEIDSDESSEGEGSDGDDGEDELAVDTDKPPVTPGNQLPRTPGSILEDPTVLRRPGWRLVSSAQRALFSGNTV